MPGKNVVILGGGFGGAATAITLRKLLDTEHSVTVVDRVSRTYLGASMARLAIGDREPAKISRSLGALTQRGVRYHQAEIEEIDTTNQSVKTSVATLNFDYLVISTGTDYDWEAVSGSKQEHSFYNIESATRLRTALRKFQKGRIVIAISRLPYKCPPAPYEAAMLIDKFLDQRGYRNLTDIHLFTPEPAPLGITGPESSAALEADLGRSGITLHTGENLSEINSGAQEAKFLSGNLIDYNLLITIPVHRSSKVVRDANLTDGSGWIPVNPANLETTSENVYAIGDVNFLPMANGVPLPKAGVFASGEARIVANNIAAKIYNQSQSVFEGDGFCFVDQGTQRGRLISGGFLNEGAPNVTLSPSSTKFYAKKIRFESDWRKWKI